MLDPRLLRGQAEAELPVCNIYNSTQPAWTGGERVSLSISYLISSEHNWRRLHLQLHELNP